jgi:Rad3-related DNA helicase
MFRKPTDCPYIDTCPYQVAKIACMEAQARVLNFHYANFARWWREMVDDLFIDECHRLPVVLSSLVAVEMRDKHRAWLGLPAFPFAVGGAPVMLKRAMQWADRCVQALLPMTKVKDIKKQRSAKYQRAQLEMLAATLNETSAEWYVESRPGEKFFARPVVPGPYSSQLLEPRARSQVLMSATIGGEKGAEVLARELAIDDYEFVTYPHIFPKENRPVLFYTKAPKLSYRSPDGDYDRQIKMMVEVLRAHDGEKGIVHTASWKHAERIAKGLRREGYQGNVMIPRGDRVQSIRDFKQMKGSVAVVSPSWKEGLDFADDLWRWTIIAKIPFLSCADPVVKLRAKRPGGRGWIDWNAALAVVQAAGRGVRSETDYATTYILDGNWTRVARMAPHWFEWEKV